MHDRRQQIQDDDYSFPYHYVPKFRPGYSQSYSWPWGLYYVSAMEFILDKLRPHDPRAIADVGTGDGRLVRELAHIFPEAQVVGIDYSERAIQLAKALNPTLDFRCIDIIQDKVEETFDVVTLIEVFEHIPPELAEKFAAALRPLVRDNGHSSSLFRTKTYPFQKNTSSISLRRACPPTSNPISYWRKLSSWTNGAVWSTGSGSFLRITISSWFIGAFATVCTRLTNVFFWLPTRRTVDVSICDFALGQRDMVHR